MRRFTHSLLVVSLLSVGAVSARAQLVPLGAHSTPVSPASTAPSPVSPGELSLSADTRVPAARSALLDPELPLLRLRRYTPGARTGGRWMVTIGAALVAGGGLIAATMGRRECYDDSSDMAGARISGGVTVGLGLAFTLAGSIWLGASGPARPDRRRSHIINHVFGSILFAAITSGLLWGANFGSLIDCVSS